MIWIGIAVVVVALALALVVVVQRRLKPTDEDAVDVVDPLFTTGIAITGAGVALATTVGAFMYIVMIVGLILMAIGANRTHPHR